MRLKISYVSQVPIVGGSLSHEKDIDEMINRIKEIKKENPKADTSVLEAEIDQLVYQLYRLTEEEIQLVEESVR